MISTRRTSWLQIAAIAGSLFASEALPSSLQFLANRPEKYDFVDIPRLPEKFGKGSSPSRFG